MRTKSKDTTMVAVVVFLFFMTEAIVHYNMGQQSADSTHEFGIPEPKDLLEIAVLVGLFSYASSLFLTR